MFTIDTNTISPFLKRENEDDFTYHKRLVYGKLKDKTLADYDYSELAQYVYGKDYSGDVARRMMYGSCRTLELMESNHIDSVSNSDIITEIESKKIELQKERQRFQDQRREYKKLINKDGRDEHLREIIEEAAFNLVDKVGLTINDDFVLDVSNSDNEAILVLNDWHYGMTTNNVFNQFNTNICRQRVARITELSKMKLSLHQCSKLHIVVLGDLVHGSCHTSCRVASEELTSDQLMQASELLAELILTLRNFVPEVVVYSTYGNHARVIQNKDESIHRDNWERIIPWWLESRIAAEENKLGTKLNITIAPESDYEFISLNVCGHEFCAAHGDLDSVKSSPRLLSTLFQKKLGKDLECVLLGDKHHRESFDELGVTAIICDSLCGVDEYANNKRLYSDPAQFMMIVNRLTGLDAEYRLKC